MLAKASLSLDISEIGYILRLLKINLRSHDLIIDLIFRTVYKDESS